MVGFCCSGDQLSGPSALELPRFWEEAGLSDPDLEECCRAEAFESGSIALALLSLDDVCVHGSAPSPEARRQLAEDLQTR